MEDNICAIGCIMVKIGNVPAKAMNLAMSRTDLSNDASRLCAPPPPSPLNLNAVAESESVADRVNLSSRESLTFFATPAQGSLRKTANQNLRSHFGLSGAFQCPQQSISA